MIVRAEVQRTVAAGLIIGIIAFIDWHVELDVAFGFLYVFPLILVGTVLPRWQVVLVAILCTALADIFDPYPFVVGVTVPHDILVFTSLAGTGFFTHYVTRSRHFARQAEEQFEFFVQTSPAAILTMTEDGKILLANAAAHRLFRVPSGSLCDRNISAYVPTLARITARDRPFVSRAPERGMVQFTVQCRGDRETGEGFLADVFFSMYQTVAGPRIAAVIIDVSEALREREISGLDQLLAGSRILVGAMFHEVRNVCSAMAIAYETMVRSGQLTGNKDFEALGALVGTLARVAGAQLKQSETDSEATVVHLADVLADLRLVLDPYCEEAGIVLRWDTPADLSPVWADRQRLLQVLLNLMRNSERALAECDVKRIEVTVSVTESVASIRVTDTGPGLPSAEHLFEPFQEGAKSTGLGLYLSRALLRSFRGDLRHDPSVPGCSFVIELPIVDEEPDDTSDGTDAHGSHPIAVG
jgi:PAS domain S-box-containing protein